MLEDDLVIGAIIIPDGVLYTITERDTPFGAFDQIYVPTKTPPNYHVVSKYSFITFVDGTEYTFSADAKAYFDRTPNSTLLKFTEFAVGTYYFSLLQVNDSFTATPSLANRLRLSELGVRGENINHILNTLNQDDIVNVSDLQSGINKFSFRAVNAVPQGSGIWDIFLTASLIEFNGTLNTGQLFVVTIIRSQTHGTVTANNSGGAGESIIDSTTYLLKEKKLNFKTIKSNDSSVTVTTDSNAINLAVVNPGNFSEWVWTLQAGTGSPARGGR